MISKAKKHQVLRQFNSNLINGSIRVIHSDHASTDEDGRPDDRRGLTVHLMDGCGRRTIKNIKMWTEPHKGMNRWTKVRPRRPASDRPFLTRLLKSEMKQ